MLTVKKNTYGAIPKNNECTKLTTDIKQAIQKIEEEKYKKHKAINDYANLIQSIKKEYQNLALEIEILKEKLTKLEVKQLTTDLKITTENNKKFLKEQKEKDTIKNKPHIVKAVAVPNLNITCRRKEKQRKKRQKKYKIYYDNDGESNE